MILGIIACVSFKVHVKPSKQVINTTDDYLLTVMVCHDLSCHVRQESKSKNNPELTSFAQKQPPRPLMTDKKASGQVAAMGLARQP
jgi:hypothetical protein